MAERAARFPPDYERLLDAAPDGMVIVDSEGRIVLANARTEDLFGYSRAELVGQRVELLMPSRKRAAHERHREGYSAEPRVRAMGAGLQLEGQRKDGSEFPVEISLSPLRIHGDSFTIAAIRDVSERKLAEARERRQLVTRQVVRQLLRQMTGAGAESAARRRELGRSLAAQTAAATLEEHLDALDAAGIGVVRLDAAEGDRFTFAGDGLLEVTPGYAAPTCHIALGYLEGALQALRGRPALGSEVACQSRGHARCRFVVSLR